MLGARISLQFCHFKRKSDNLLRSARQAQSKRLTQFLSKERKFGSEVKLRNDDLDQDFLPNVW